PTPKDPPDFQEFLKGVTALQTLQDRAQIVFGVEERAEPQGSPLPPDSVTARDMVEAAKSGYEYRRNEASEWLLVKKTGQPAALRDPQAADAPDTRWGEEEL